MNSLYRDRPDAIVLTMSKGFVKDWGGEDVVMRYFRKDYGPDGSSLFYWKCGNLPRIEVPVMFMTMAGKIVIKFRIVEYFITPAGGIILGVSPRERERMGRNVSRRWPEGQKFIIVTGPVEFPEQEIPYKGFQGFRYSEMLF